MKRFITLSLSALIVLATFTACGHENTNESAIEQTVSGDSTQTVDVTESTEELSSDSFEETTVSSMQEEFNIDNALQNIAINGNTINVPTTVDELGNDYTLKENMIRSIQGTHDDWGECAIGSLYYKGEKIAGVISEPSSVLKPLDHCKIFNVTVYDYSNANVYGLEIGMDIEEMFKLWGQPNDIDEGKTGNRPHYFYGGQHKENKYIEVEIVDKKIHYISVLNK